MTNPITKVLRPGTEVKQACKWYGIFQQTVPENTKKDLTMHVLAACRIKTHRSKVIVLLRGPGCRCINLLTYLIGDLDNDSIQDPDSSLNEAEDDNQEFRMIESTDSIIESVLIREQVLRTDLSLLIINVMVF